MKVKNVIIHGKHTVRVKIVTKKSKCIAYCDELEITGHGKNEKEALDNLKQKIQEYLFDLHLEKIAKSRA